MSTEQFWKIIEEVHQASKGDMDRKCELLEAKLRDLGLAEVISFSDHFDGFEDQAYSYDLWAAAYIINHGCSDDAFSDFRSTLISMGRQTFERALADPQSLADMDYDAEIACYEGFQYVPTTVGKALNGGKVLPRSRPGPEEPSGTPWREDEEAAQRYPKLAEKYRFGVKYEQRPWWKFWS